MLPLHVMNDSTETRSARPVPLNLNGHNTGFNITSFTVQTPTSQQAPTSLARPPNPPRWKSPEFLIYGSLFLIVFPMMVYSPIHLSNGKWFIFSEARGNIEAVFHSESHPNYYLFQTKLSNGWIAGRRVVSRASTGARIIDCPVRITRIRNTAAFVTICSTYIEYLSWPLSLLFLLWCYME
jgi:hypothetical protein